MAPSITAPSISNLWGEWKNPAGQAEPLSATNSREASHQPPFAPSKWLRDLLQLPRTTANAAENLALAERFQKAVEISCWSL